MPFDKLHLVRCLVKAGQKGQGNYEGKTGHDQSGPADCSGTSQQENNDGAENGQKHRPGDYRIVQIVINYIFHSLPHKDKGANDAQCSYCHGQTIVGEKTCLNVSQFFAESADEGGDTVYNTFYNLRVKEGKNNPV